MRNSCAGGLLSRISILCDRDTTDGQILRQPDVLSDSLLAFGSSRLPQRVLIAVRCLDAVEGACDDHYITTVVI